MLLGIHRLPFSRLDGSGDVLRLGVNTAARRKIKEYAGGI